jgi:NAD(P)-dependent dehydrogenase (short-subunit alcohol dehydrogenase family)
MQISAAGQRVIITAGAGGIGRAIADLFDDEGAKVSVCDIDPRAVAELAAARPNIHACVADVSDQAALDSYLASAVERLGGLDALINNAGISGPTARIDEIDTDAWEKTMRVNVDSQYRCSRFAVPHLRAAGGGAILNMSSTAGRLGFPLRSPYAASKFAVVGFTKTLAMELGPFGIRVNCIMPGVVDGERIRRVIAAKAEAAACSYEAMESRWLEQVSLRRMVPPIEIAQMFLYLCSEAGRNISGQSISICGNTEILH